ncbi:Organic cation transporter-like protein [Lamellibrachia satsuma]|nr:Organic cation transporter-like protein [Lamellibrachia satsuma]
MDVDELLRALGRPGRYSLAIYLLLCTNFALVSISHFTMTIYGSPIPHHCAAPGRRDAAGTVHRGSEAGLALDSCSVFGNWSGVGNETAPCPAGWVYDAQPRERNVLMEFDMVCERTYLTPLATSIYFFGVMLGGLTFGPLGEKYGRRPVLLASLVAAVVSSVSLTLADSYVVFVLIRLANGFFLQGVYGTTSVLVIEQSPPDLSIYAGTFLDFFWAAGIMVLALASYLLPDWRLTQLAVTLPSVLLAVLMWFVPESVRWSVMRRKYSQAETVLRTAARFNGVDLPEVLFRDDCNGATPTTPGSDVAHPVRTVSSRIDGLPASKTCERRTYTAVDMFRTPKLRKWSIIFAYNWFVISVVLYGLSSIITSMDGNKYFILFLCGAVEVPVTTISAFIFKRFGRKRPLCVLLFVAGVSSTMGAFIPKDLDIGWLETTLALVCRTCITVCFVLLSIYTCEVFPTVMRNTSLGVCAFFTRLGGVVSPQVVLLGSTSLVQFPLVVFGALSLVGGLLALSLPETLHQRLPDTIEQAETTTCARSRSELPADDTHSQI